MAAPDRLRCPESLRPCEDGCPNRASCEFAAKARAVTTGPNPTDAQWQAAKSGPPARMNDSERLGYDAVNLPDHYRAFKIEPIRFCQENNLDPCQTAVVKYVTRFRLKNGVEDLFKARRMLDMLIAYEQNNPDWWTMKSSETG